MKIVGLTGVAGSGKDTAAELLVRDHGFVRVALADGMKRICAEVFGFTNDQLWGPSEKRNAPDARFPRAHAGPVMGRCYCCGIDLDDVDACNATPCFLTPRHALQQLGTEWGRACFEDVWVQHAMFVAGQVLDAGCPYAPEIGPRPRHPDDDAPFARGVVISDVRFDNEARAIRSAGGRVVRILRGGAGLAGAAAAHTSESGVDLALIDSILPNHGTLDDLAADVGSFAAKLANAWRQRGEAA